MQIHHDQAFDLGEKGDRWEEFEEDDDEDCEYVGTRQSIPRTQQEELEEATPLRELEDDETPCGQCGCDCQMKTGGARRGKGSTKLSVPIRANILSQSLVQSIDLTFL